MGDHSPVSVSSRNSEAGKKASKINLVASGPKAFLQNSNQQVALFSRRKIRFSGGVAAGDVAVFLLKVAALEIVRRVSKAKCPCIWRGIQALQFVCYPPFKLIQRWAPFKVLVRGMQMLSRPLLLISVAEAFSEQSGSSDENSDDNSGSHAYSEIHEELSSVQCPPDTRVSDEVTPSLTSENWLLQLYNELENQSISLPERINEDELRRFYTASNGDISSLLASIKKTIRWRETYRILSEEELEAWSDMVFWHGFDVQHQPCLIVRLGLACFVLPSHDRPRFAQAVISQVEHGVLCLVDEENPKITVLVDCEGLSPLRIPMQIMKSCSSLLQDHFPNRLGCLLVIRLPPMVRVITQTFIQVSFVIILYNVNYECTLLNECKLYRVSNILNLRHNNYNLRLEKKVSAATLLSWRHPDLSWHYSTIFSCPSGQVLSRLAFRLFLLLCTSITCVLSHLLDCNLSYIIINHQLLDSI